MDYFTSVTLLGARVVLSPLSLAHVRSLEAAGNEPEIWRWLPTQHHEPGTMMKFVESALADQRAKHAVPFAIIDKISGRAVGSTRFHYIEQEHRRLEIGFTWISPQFQRTHVNTETKLLQMWYCFCILGCRRVEWKVDTENSKSRDAVLRIGAKEEGVFRQHMLYADGRNRDSVYFSILDKDWPHVDRDLRKKLGYDVAPSIR